MSNLAVVNLARLTRDPERAEAIADNWKMSSVEKKQLLWTVGEYDDVKSFDRMRYLITVDQIDRQWVYDLLISVDHIDLLKQVQAWKTPEFLVNGNDLLDRGFKGPEIGAQLKRLKDNWALSGYKMTREELLEMV